MKKLTLAIAVLAVLSISLVSFTNSTSSQATSEDQSTYVWIRWGCGAVGSANPMIGYYETSSPDMLPGNCPENQSSGVCALQFNRSQVTCSGGVAWLRDNANPWTSYRMIKYCTN